MKYYKKSLLRLVAVCIMMISGMTTALADEYYDQRVHLFDMLPINQNDIVFLGNSITDGGEFNELFQMHNIKNRGIRSDVISGIEKRTKQVTKGKPKKIFLLIGINDVSHGLTPAQLGERYEKLVKKIKEESPSTQLYLQSVMPINNGFKRYKALKGKECIILEFNKIIKNIAEENGATYIDLWPFLADSKGNLKKEFTNDGLHLNGSGYRAWTEGIKKFVVND